MFIQTNALSDETRMEFYPGKAVSVSGHIEISRDNHSASPLAARLFEINEVNAVVLMSDKLVVEKNANVDWAEIRMPLLAAIMQHYESGDPVVIESSDTSEADQEIIDQVKDLLQTRIVPAVTQSGGDVAFHSYKNGNIYLNLQGSAFSMLTGIQNMLCHYVPEISAVLDYREALPRPGLSSDAGVAIKQLLDERINPSIASHGGHIALVDVKENQVFVRLEGGCQGCGMADVTLKQGVATEIMAMVPEITDVLDVTDHAGGENPYYQPGK